MSASQKQKPAAAAPAFPDVTPPQCAASDEVNNPLSPEEAEQLRKERLETIRAAIARGDYDSDELLEKALSRMLPGLEDDNSAV